jgi:multidrug efflux system membrane fusion protein
MAKSELFRDSEGVPTQQRTLVSTKPETSPVQDKPPRRSHRTRLWLGLLAAALAGVVIYYLVTAKSESTTPAGGRRSGAATPVTGTKARLGSIGIYDAGLGTVTPLYTVSVKTRVDGQLMNVYYKEGQSVQKGTLLAEIDPRPYEVQLTQAQGQLAKDQAALENAQIDLQRYETLLPKNAIPEQTVATQKATIVQDQGAVKIDQGNIDSAKLNLVYCRITSPIAGRIGLRLVDPGNIVNTTDATGLMVITQVEPISVIFTISEDQLPPVLQRFHAGQRLEVSAYDRENTSQISSGTVTTLDNQIDPTTGTVKLRAVFANKDEALFPNQFVNAHLLVEEKKNVMLVPNAAIQRNGQSSFVYLVKPDQSVTMRPIKVGTTQGLESEVVSGLSAGDTVVTSGVDKLQEGSKVVVEVPKTTGQQPATANQSGTPGNTGQGNGAAANPARRPQASGNHQQGGR